MRTRAIFFYLLCVMICSLCPGLNEKVYAQQHIIVSLASVDGIDITPDNILDVRLQSVDNKSTTVLVKGTIKYRSSPLSMSWSFRYTLQPGMNTLSSGSIHPQWQFSSTALQELFFTHRLLPAGAYEYCVTADPVNSSNEIMKGGGEECIYHRPDNPFLINLLTPDNKAKLHEYYPMLSWVANYAFVSELTYRLRVAEIKQGQNASNAVTRNQPIYDEKNLFTNSQVYPVYAKPLIKDRPYAWTVDAYYKGLLLGSAEAWQFTIIDDSVIKGPPGVRSYIDIRKENGTAKLCAEGALKLKYVLENTRTDTLSLKLYDEAGAEISLKDNRLAAVYGDNRYEIILKDNMPLKHAHRYRLVIATKYAERFTLPFEYLNPDFKQ